jgi:glutathione S-transferase
LRRGGPSGGTVEVFHVKVGPSTQLYRLVDPVAAEGVHTKSPEFLKINPNGHVPSIEDDV